MALVAFFTIIFLTRCCKESEDKAQGHVYYSFDWSKALPGFSIPQQLRYCFYPTDGGSVILLEHDAKELTFALPPARYRMLIVNCDATDFALRNMEQYDTAEAFIAATKAADRTPPGGIPLYGIAIDEVEIVPGQNSPIQYTPLPLVRNVLIDIKINGTEHITECAGSIRGVAAALNLSRQEIIPEATTAVAFTTTPTEAGVNASVVILGKPKEKGEEPPAGPTHEVKLDFTLVDGSNASTSINLGSSIEETTGDKVEVNIEATISHNPTFSITINQWEVAPGDSLLID